MKLSVDIFGAIPIMGAVMRTLHINAETQTITETECNGLADEQAAVGGNIESAHYFENGTDRVMVNEDGLFTLPQTTGWFFVEGAFNPFKGNGIVVGVDERTGDTVNAKMSLADLKGQIMFMSATEVAHMAQARRASQTVK
jgi:hypothetical protein